MALDRASIVRNVYDTLGAPLLGPFVRRQWSADTTIAQLPYDTIAAARLLDSLGWKRGATGVRARRGERLAFTIMVAATNRARVRVAELVQRQLSLVGVAVQLEPLDGRAFGGRLSAHQFDAALFSFTATPSPSGLRQSWTSGAYAMGSAYNAGGYANPAFDAEVDSGLGALDMRAARAHLRIAYEIAVQDPPAIWLYEPELPAAVNSRVVTGPWNADAWWQSIRNWDVTGPARVRGATASANVP